MMKIYAISVIIAFQLLFSLTSSFHQQQLVLSQWRFRGGRNLSMGNARTVSSRNKPFQSKNAASVNNRKGIIKPFPKRNQRPRTTPPQIVSKEVSRDIMSVKGKTLTTQNIFGQNIVTCRNFRMDLSKSLSFLQSYNSLKAMPAYSIPEIAFVGRSNVGKSSLLNAICGSNKNIAVESKQPGRTQLMNHFLCGDTDGDICIFTDLPGYGFAKVSKETQENISKFVHEYLSHRKSLKLTCLLVDARREPQPADVNMVKFLDEVGGNYLIVATKVDKVSKAELETSLKRLHDAFGLPPEIPICRFSSITGEGKKQLWHQIKDAMLDEGIFAYEADDYDDEDENETTEENSLGIYTDIDDFVN